MTTAHDGVRIVTITPGSAEVRLGAGRAVSCIGKIRSSNGRWFWEHRDGEKSSPVAANQSDAANALAAYHRAFKDRSSAATLGPRLLLG